MREARVERKEPGEKSQDARVKNQESRIKRKESTCKNQEPRIQKASKPFAGLWRIFIMMFYKAIFPVVILCISFIVKGQSPIRYKDVVFSAITVDKDQSYSDRGDTKKNKFHLFDLYQPRGDPATGRPLIIWMHGGGFRFGSKDAAGIQLWCKNFARRGYVCAAINYTLGKKMSGFNYDQLQKGCYYAVADAKTAVAYFRKHSNEYHIDPDKIILAGNSAGGMIALQAAYSTDAALAKMAGIDTGNEQTGLLKVAAVINFWGGIFDLNWLKNAQVPVVNVLGSNDKVMPPTQKGGPLYGGIAIHQEADKLHIPNQLKVFEGYGHELQRHFNPVFPVGNATKKRWTEAGAFAADFLYGVLFK